MADAGAPAIDINSVNNEDTSGQVTQILGHIGSMSGFGDQKEQLETEIILGHIEPANGFGDQIEKLETEIRRLKQQNREIIKSMTVLTSLCAELTACFDSQRASLTTLKSVAMGHDNAIAELGVTLDTVITNLNHVSKIVNQRVLGNYE